MIPFGTLRTATHLLARTRPTVAVGKAEHCILRYNNFTRLRAATRLYGTTTHNRRLAEAAKPPPGPVLPHHAPRPSPVVTTELKTAPPTISAGGGTQLKNSEKVLSGTQLTVKAGLPLVLFALLSAWVVSNAYGGKLRELEASQGKASVSIRQAAVEQEHEEMLERLNQIVAADFDNTKRIKRPEEVLEERRRERKRRNAWYRRLYRWVFRQGNEVA